MAGSADGVLKACCVATADEVASEGVVVTVLEAEGVTERGDEYREDEDGVEGGKRASDDWPSTCTGEETIEWKVDVLEDEENAGVGVDVVREGEISEGLERGMSSEDCLLLCWALSWASRTRSRLRHAQTSSLVGAPRLVRSVRPLSQFEMALQ